MRIRNKIIIAAIAIGLFQGAVMLIAVIIYAANVTGQSVWNISSIIELFPGLSVASVLIPVVIASFVISLILLISYLHYIVFNPLKQFQLLALRARSGEFEPTYAPKGNDEITDAMNALSVAIRRQRSSYDSLTSSLHGQFAALGHDAEILKLLVDQLPLGILLLKEPEQEILRMNERAVELIGKNISSTGGMSSFIKQNGNPYPQEELPYTIVRRAKVSTTKSDIYFRYPDMRVAAFRMTSVPVLGTDGAVMYTITTILDITDIKQVEREKSDFVSLASHQLRTPISIINWYVELLNSPEDLGRLSDDQKSFVAQIKESSMRMSKLIDTLLNASRIELGTFHGEGGYFDIVQVVDVSVIDIMALAQSKHIKISKNYDLSTPLISGDPKLGQVVVQNLISNAVKYTNENGNIIITEESIPEKESVRLTIQDNGIGIPDAEASRIFSRFYRASNAREVDSSGSGLGLSIVRSLLERAGGSISFSKVPLGGTKFEIILPYTCKNI